MAERVVIHVGAPKTGTSFVQDRLFRNPQALAAQGVLYPGDRPDAHFLAALDLMGLKWGGLEAEAVGYWRRLVDQVNAHQGTAIISHEIFGIATAEQVATALAEFGGAEIHVVASARDLARQIPAEWQENVKHRRELPYATFLQRIQDPARDSVVGWWFWGVQHIPEVLGRWAADVAPERVHLVTVPPSGSAPETLWQRFVTALGISDEGFDLEAERANPSLGVPESDLVRRLNVLLKPVLPNHHYRPLVREVLVHQNLSRRRDSARLSLPPEAYDWVGGLAEEWISELAGRGYDVIGDLAELRPAPPADFVDPDHSDPGQVAEAGLAGLAAMVVEAARLRDQHTELEARIADLEGAIARIEAAPDYRVKKKLVELAHTNPLTKSGLAAYRKAFRR